MALVLLTRDTPEKGQKVTSMNCNEEYVERFLKRGWKIAGEKPVEENKQETAPDEQKDKEVPSESKADEKPVEENKEKAEEKPAKESKHKGKSSKNEEPELI